MGLKFPYKLDSLSLEVGGQSYGQSKNIGSEENLTESPHKTYLPFSHKLFLIRGHNQNNNTTNKKEGCVRIFFLTHM